MTEFRLTQISDTHLARRLQKLTDNFHRVSEHIDATRPDLVINSGDISFDGPTSRSDLEFAKELHDALPVPCRLSARQSRHRRQPDRGRSRCRSNRRPRKSGRIISLSSAKTAGASTKPAGASSG